MGIVPIANAGSTYTACAAIPNSANRWAWFGLVPNLGASGASVVILAGSTATGSPLLPIIAASGGGVVMQGPIISPSAGFFAACLTTGSLVYWTAKKSGDPNLMAYATTCQVYAHVHSLVSPASAFDTSTCPSTSEVTVWLTGGCAVINSRLAAGGFGAIPTTSAAYDLASAANALYGAWMAERQRVNARVSADERTRADMFKRDFEFHLNQLVMLDLGALGVSQTSRVYAGGISVTDKETQEADTDRVKPRFHRGMGHNPEAGQPRADSNNDD